MDGIELKIARIRARIEQGTVADALGLHRATLIRWEKEPALPDWKARSYLDAIRQLTDVKKVQNVTANGSYVTDGDRVDIPPTPETDFPLTSVLPPEATGAR